jgi:hypothetical protein
MGVKTDKFIIKFFYGFGLLTFIIGIAIFRPVPIVAESKAIVQTGVVDHIYEGGENDVVIRLQGHQRRYYINRGLENGLEIQNLRDRLIGNEVVIKYPKYWTPLDWNNTIRHMSKLEFEGEVLFNELK